jgi:hypothetical protein
LPQFSTEFSFITQDMWQEEDNRINDRKWLGTVSLSVDNKLATYGVPSVDELCDDEESGGSNGAVEEWDKRNPGPVMSFTKARSNYEAVKASFTCTA